MGKTRDLFKKIRDTKGTRHTKMRTIKDKNGKDLRETDEMKQWWQEFTEELCQKSPNDPDNHNGVITHLEPDILECEVKWILGSIITNKTSGGDGIPAELFQILNDDAVKVLAALNMPANLENSAVATRLEKTSFHSILKKGNAKECSNHHTIVLISHASKVMLKILQTRPQQHVNQ